MKKSVFFLLVFIGWAACHAQAQTKGFTGAVWEQVIMGLNGNDDFKASNLAVAIGYSFNDKLFLRLQAEAAVDLFKKEGTKTYRSNGMLGASLGYNIIRGKYALFDATLAAGNSLRTKVWNYTWCDLGLHLSLNRYPPKPFIGVGTRYYASHDKTLDNRWTFYVGIGFRFN